jgi:hypothetical protein
MDCTAYPQLLGQRAFGRKPVSIPEFTVNDHRHDLLIMISYTFLFFTGLNILSPFRSIISY